MAILSLPTEVLIQILAAAAQVRGLKRALRLRLVCQIFYTRFYDALFTTDLLDSYASSGSLDYTSRFFLEKQVPESVYHLWQTYLSFRVQSPNRIHTQRMAMIKQTAELFCLEAGLSGKTDVEECIWKLSDIRINQSLESLFGDPITPAKSDLHLDTQRALLVVAARMNNVPLAQKILEEWTAKDKGEQLKLFGRHNGFRCASYIAARSASNEVLELFLQHKGFFKLPQGIWQGCGLGGTDETLDVIFKHKMDGVRSVMQGHRSGKTIRRVHDHSFFGLFASDSLAFFDKLRGLWLRNSDLDPNVTSITKEGYGEVMMAFYASWGSIEMVEHLIKLNVPVNADPGKDPETQPLRAASRGFYPDVVKLLLKHGADPNQCNVLVQGAKSGSLQIVRILLANGACVKESAEHLVKVSVSLEHTCMFKLLRDHGALTKEAWETGLQEALKERLDSMVTLLQANEYSKVA